MTTTASHTFVKPAVSDTFLNMSTDSEQLDGPGDFMASSPPSPPTSELLQTPRLDLCKIDSLPFSHNFSDMLDGFGLLSEGDESPDVSYYLENITNIKDIMPDWQHDDIEEIVVMSAKRPSILPTIREARNEVSHRIPSAVLGDFSLDDQDSVFENSTYRRCIRRDTGVVYAIKRARANLGSTIRQRSILEALVEIGVPFVTHLQWAFQDGEQFYWVIDHHDKGNLFEYVQGHGPLDSVRTVFYASEVIVALSSLHGIGIVFQCLNPSSVMFGFDGHILLSDFSHADFESSIGQCGMPKKSLAAIMPEYIAPETVLGWARNAAVDWWSFGALVYFMVFGTHPFGKSDTTNGTDYVCDRIVKFAIPSDSLRFISPIARDLISKCLQRNPAIRLTMDKIKRHPYFSSVDWHMVSSNRVDVPSLPISTPTITRESQRNRLSLHAPLLSPDPDVDSDHQISSSSVNCHQRRQSIVSIISKNNVSTPSASFKPAVKILVPSIVAEEDEAISDSEASAYVALQEGLDRQPEKAERMAHFWDTLDKEEGCSVSSAPSQEFGELGTRTGKPPKLRKHRSSIHPRLRFNFSTSSFQLRLKRKPRSTGALRDPILKPTQEAVDLPNGIHQLGSGIGFTYNMPAQAPSQLSVRSFTPSCGQNFFQGGFSVKTMGRGFGTRKVKAKPASNSLGFAVTPLPAATDQECLAGASVRPLRLREAGSGTFMRDMYRTPSWILSPPDCLPSPMALVIGETEVCDSTSPQTSSEPLTPATLVNVDLEDDDGVNISIPKDLELDSNGVLSLAPDSTLRLVPQSAARLSFGEDVDTSLFSYVSIASSV